MIGIVLNTAGSRAQVWRIDEENLAPVNNQPLAKPPINTLSRKDAEKKSSLSHNLEETLFNNICSTKASFASISMHLPTQWRESIFRQIDYLLSIDNWEEDSSQIDNSSFGTFLRFLIYSETKRLPSLGVSRNSNLLASWHKENKFVSIEFLPHDMANAILASEGRAKQVVSWNGHIVDLSKFIKQFGNVDCLKDQLDRV